MYLQKLNQFVNILFFLLLRTGKSYSEMWKELQVIGWKV